MAVGKEFWDLLLGYDSLGSVFFEEKGISPEEFSNIMTSTVETVWDAQEEYCQINPDTPRHICFRRFLEQVEEWEYKINGSEDSDYKPIFQRVIGRWKERLDIKLQRVPSSGSGKIETDLNKSPIRYIGENPNYEVWRDRLVRSGFLHEEVNLDDFIAVFSGQRPDHKVNFTFKSAVKLKKFMQLVEGRDDFTVEEYRYMRIANTCDLNGSEINIKTISTAKTDFSEHEDVQFASRLLG